MAHSSGATRDLGCRDGSGLSTKKAAMDTIFLYSAGCFAKESPASLSSDPNTGRPFSGLGEPEARKSWAHASCT